MRAIPCSIAVLICLLVTSFPERARGQSNENEIRTLFKRFKLDIDSRNYSDALAAANDAVAKAKALPKPNPQLFADALSFQGIAQHENGQAALAATTYRTAIVALSNVYGSQSLFVAGALNNLGRFEADAGNYEAARKTLLSSLSIKQKLPNGATSQVLISTLYNLSDVALAVRDYSAAETHLNEIVNIFSQIGVQVLSDYLDTMLALAHVKYAKSEDAAGQEYG
jgi:tetratricopeptide (TPR) repeat protein